MQGALLTTDVSKMYHVNRGKPPGREKGQEHVIKAYASGTKRLVSRVGDAVPVLRVLVSGASAITRASTGLVGHARIKGGGQDLVLVVDNGMLNEVFGAKLASFVRGVKA